MTVIKLGESLERYGRNRGGRYIHIIRGGKFVEGAKNIALCSVDVTKPATEKDRRAGYEICWQCEDHEKNPTSAPPVGAASTPDAEIIADWTPKEMRQALVELAEYAPLGFDRAVRRITAARRTAGQSSPSQGGGQ